MRIRRVLVNRQGISLVEVLVTIAVFLLGIVAVVRMFPRGFAVVKHSEEVTLANRLAQAEIERWKGMAGNLPGGLLPYGYDAELGIFTVLPQLDPDNLRLPAVWPVTSRFPNGTNPYYYSDVNKFRYVYAEATKIPVPAQPAQPGQPSLGSIYVLAFSPIAYNPAVEGEPVTVYSAPLRRRYIWRAIPRLRHGGEYAIDYDNAILYFRPVGYPRQFVITYSYWDGQDLVDGRPSLKSIVSETVFLPAGADHVDIPVDSRGTPVSSVSGFMFIDHGSDSLHRKFTQLGLSDVWDPDDPYQYKLLDYVAGVVAFNPFGYGYEEYTARGRQTLTAYIDYRVLDWHIIREERKLPDRVNAPGDCEFKLSLRFIKQKGKTIEFDGSVYKGLAATPPYDYLPFDVLAVDLETGQYYTNESVLPNGNRAMTVNYKAGTVRFDPSLAGKTFRMYYKADGDWGVQVYKAYDTYRRSYNAKLDQRQYYITVDGKIGFARCNAGRTVAVDYKYEVNGRQYTVDGESFRISEKTGPNNLCYIDIIARLQQLHGPGAVPQLVEVTKVYGVTLGARVVWRDPGRAFRAGKWRSVNLQTYLTRSQV